MRKKKVNSKAIVLLTVICMLLCIFPSTKTMAIASRQDMLSYSVHVQNIGWMNTVEPGTVAGTTGKSLRMESLVLNLPGLHYRAHVQNVGWMNWVDSGEIAGTTGQGLRLEAIEIVGDSFYTANFDILYRVHVQDYGWMDWVNLGQMAGTTGESRRIEAIEFRTQLRMIPMENLSGRYLKTTPENPGYEYSLNMYSAPNENNVGCMYFTQESGTNYIGEVYWIENNEYLFWGHGFDYPLKLTFKQEGEQIYFDMELEANSPFDQPGAMKLVGLYKQVERYPAP